MGLKAELHPESHRCKTLLSRAVVLKLQPPGHILYLFSYIFKIRYMRCA